MLMPTYPIGPRCGGLLVVVLAACGSVNEPVQPDAAAMPDAWSQNCAPAPLVTIIESASPAYGNACLHGSWYLQAFNGTTTPATVGNPDNTAAVIPSSITIGSNPLDQASTFAVHVSGNGQQNTATQPAYVQLTASLNTLSATEVGSVDASAYTGIQFYAIVNTATTGARLTVANLYTDPSGGMCTTAGGTKGCYDSPAFQLTPSTTWTKYVVPFDKLTQIGFGNPSPLGAEFPKRAIVNLKWDIGIPKDGPTAPWELWVDDLTFY
jgi:hypothetical protein